MILVWAFSKRVPSPSSTQPSASAAGEPWSPSQRGGPSALKAIGSWWMNSAGPPPFLRGQRLGPGADSWLNATDTQWGHCFPWWRLPEPFASRISFSPHSDPMMSFPSYGRGTSHVGRLTHSSDRTWLGFKLGSRRLQSPFINAIRCDFFF